ncbi:MAG: di-heme oxidoredictase family protein [Novosphingobium sp.]
MIGRVVIGLAALALAAACAARSPVSRDGVRSFIRAPTTLDSEGYARFRDGRELFGKRWTEGEGLGPLFDGKSCLICHPRGGGGRPLKGADATAENASTIVRFQDDLGSYGKQLQRRAVAGQVAEGMVSVAYAETEFTFPDGEIVRLRKPRYRLTHGERGAAPDRFSVLIAPKLAGVGLIEAIPEATIRAGADPADRDGDGISGRIAVTADGKLGRFGWRAEAVSIPDQIARALAFDMGLSSDLHPYPDGDCAPDCGAASKIEVSGAQLGALVAFTRLLAPPPPGERGMQTNRGARLFAAIGCAACHRPSFEIVAAAAPYPAPPTLWAYSDLLLHDMGPGLGDSVSDEWRTAPLWGAARRRAVQGDEFYLHDGRARRLVEAVLWHGGEAARARAGFVALSPSERRALLAFVKSL